MAQAAGSPALGTAKPNLGWARHAALASLWFGFNFHWLPIGFVLIQSQLRNGLVPHDSFGTSLGLMVGAGAIFAVGLIAFALHLGWQVLRLDINDPAYCLVLFKSNRDAGLLLFGAMLLDAVF